MFLLHIIEAYPKFFSFGDTKKPREKQKNRASKNAKGDKVKEEDIAQALKEAGFESYVEIFKTALAEG